MAAIKSVPEEMAAVSLGASWTIHNIGGGIRFVSWNCGLCSIFFTNIRISSRYENDYVELNYCMYCYIFNACKEITNLARNFFILDNDLIVEYIYLSHDYDKISFPREVEISLFSTNCER